MKSPIKPLPRPSAFDPGARTSTASSIGRLPMPVALPFLSGLARGRPRLTESRTAIGPGYDQRRLSVSCVVLWGAYEDGAVSTSSDFRLLAWLSPAEVGTSGNGRQGGMRVYHREDELENHDRGLDHDLPRLLDRRGLLKLVAGAGLAGAGLVSLGACADRGGPRGAGQEPSDTSDGELPEETAGPYPGDGSNGPNLLNQSGIVRRDITSSFGSSTTKAAGVPLAISMTITDFSENKKPLAGGAVYIWHCDREGRYSLYSQGVTGENYLCGVQEADDIEASRPTTSSATATTCSCPRLPVTPAAATSSLSPARCDFPTPGLIQNQAPKCQVPGSRSPCDGAHQ